MADLLPSAGYGVATTWTRRKPVFGTPSEAVRLNVRYSYPAGGDAGIPVITGVTTEVGLVKVPRSREP